MFIRQPLSWLTTALPIASLERREPSTRSTRKRTAGMKHLRLTAPLAIAWLALGAYAGSEQEQRDAAPLSSREVLDRAFALRFEVDTHRKYCLLNGLDDIGLTLRQADKIRAFEARRREQFPWYFR